MGAGGDAVTVKAVAAHQRAVTTVAPRLSHVLGRVVDVDGAAGDQVHADASAATAPTRARVLPGARRRPRQDNAGRLTGACR